MRYENLYSISAAFQPHSRLSIHKEHVTCPSLTGQEFRFLAYPSSFQGPGPHRSVWVKRNLTVAQTLIITQICVSAKSPRQQGHFKF